MTKQANENSKPLIILSAGGTGGHVMPAQALAQDLIARGYRIEVITDARGIKFAPAFGEIPMHVVKAGTLGRGIMGKIKGVTNLALGVVRAGRLIKKLKPVAVIGFGGYPCVPGVYAAQRQKVPTILHEQNAILGWANDILAAKAKKIALSWPESQGLNAQEWKKAVVTGNPIRAEIVKLADKPYPDLENALSVPSKNKNETFRIFVMGGSLGASVFSQVIPAALSQLSSENRARLSIVQQCREEDIETAQAAYAEAGIKVELSTFVHDVASELEKCHLFIGRSGASTVAEVSAAGRPAIYVPLGIHKDNQQKMNADAISDHGGAWTFVETGFTPEALLTRIETFLADPSILTRAADKAKACAYPDAASKLGDLVEAVIKDHKG